MLALVVWWNAEKPPPSGRFDLAVQPSVNVWKGRRSVQLKLLDWRRQLTYLVMVTAVIVAAGSSKRMGVDVDKLFLEVQGLPVIGIPGKHLMHIN